MRLSLSPAEEDKHHESWAGLEAASPHTSGHQGPPTITDGPCARQGYAGRPQEYIATQGPMLNTVTDFWEMVWQEKAPLIIMITKLQERKEVPLSLPWPGPGAKGGVISTVKGYARPNVGSQHPLAFSALLSEGAPDGAHLEEESPRAAALAPSSKASPPHVASRALGMLCQLDNRIKRLGQPLGEGAEAAVSSVPPALGSSPRGLGALSWWVQAGMGASPVGGWDPWLHVQQPPAWGHSPSLSWPCPSSLLSLASAASL